MDYLFMKLIWWIALTFALGLVAGWVSCGEKKT
jgi:hypothetical protein